MTFAKWTEGEKEEEGKGDEKREGGAHASARWATKEREAPYKDRRMGSLSLLSLESKLLHVLKKGNRVSSCYVTFAKWTEGEKEEEGKGDEKREGGAHASARWATKEREAPYKDRRMCQILYSLVLVSYRYTVHYCSMIA